MAELEEGRKNYLRAHEAFTTLIEALSTDLTTLKRSIDAEVVNSLAALNASYAASAAGSGRANGAGVGTGTVGGGNQGGEPEMVDVAEVLRGQERERQAKEREVRARRQKEVDEKEKGAGLVWIMHMRFARRSEVRVRSPLRLPTARHADDEASARPPFLGHQGRPRRLCQGPQVPPRDLAGLRGLRSVRTCARGGKHSSLTAADTHTAALLLVPTLPPCLQL